MNIIIPMAGAGRRFSEAGYREPKPMIPTTDRRTGKKYPMVVCATMDLPGIEKNGGNITYIDRNFPGRDEVEQAIRTVYPAAQFITVEHLTEGQAATCLLAKAQIDHEDELLIAGCDNGMVMDESKFDRMRQEADALVFTYRHNDAVLKNPDAYGWVQVDAEDTITRLSVKKAISATPMEDHAIVATFWFRRGSDFVRAAEKMIRENDRIQGEFYVDEVIKHILSFSLTVKVFEIERYIGWGTPQDYESYEGTLAYWRGFVTSETFIPQD